MPDLAVTIFKPAVLIQVIICRLTALVFDLPASLTFVTLVSASCWNQDCTPVTLRKGRFPQPDMRRWIQPRYFQTLVLTVLKPSCPHEKAPPAANGRREAIPTWTMYDAFLMRKSGPTWSNQHQLIPLTCRVHICQSFPYSPKSVSFSRFLYSPVVTIGTCTSCISAFGRIPILYWKKPF